MRGEPSGDEGQAIVSGGNSKRRGPESGWAGPSWGVGAGEGSAEVRSERGQAGITGPGSL